MNKRIEQHTQAVLYRPVLSGLAFAYVLTLTCTLIYAIVVVAAPLAEKSASLVIRGTVMFAAFAGGLYAGRRSDRVGWLHGALVGILYVAGVMLVGRFVVSEIAPTVIVAQRLAVASVVAAIGGIAGVNL